MQIYFNHIAENETVINVTVSLNKLSKQLNIYFKTY